MVKKLSFDQAKALLDQRPDCLLLDVREEEEYITGHAVDAALLPVDEIGPESAAEIIQRPDRPVLLYCRSGRRSREAAEKLEKLGYTQLYDLGSLIGWPYGLE